MTPLSSQSVTEAGPAERLATVVRGVIAASDADALLLQPLATLDLFEDLRIALAAYEKELGR